MTGKADIIEVPEENPEEKPEEKPGEEPSEADQINYYLDRGYSAKQLIDELQFKRTTVRQEVAKRVKGEGNGKGKAAGGETKIEVLPAKIDDRKQQIVPEYLLKHFVRLDDGRALTPLETLILFQAARRSVMEDVGILQGLSEVQSKTIDSQLKILREAKSESAEVAQEAAERTVGGVLPQILDAVRQAAIASSPNPFATMMTQAMSPMFQQAMGGLMGMFTPKHGQQSPSQEQENVEQPPQQPSWSPPNIKEHRRDELEE